MMVAEGSFWVMISAARLVHCLQSSRMTLSLLALGGLGLIRRRRNG